MNQSDAQQTNPDGDALPYAAMRGGVTALDVERLMGMLPGFVHVFNHLTHSNDYISGSLAEHLGYSDEEFRRFGGEVFMHVVHADDHPRLSAHVQRIAQLEGDQTAEFEYRVLTKQGAVRWFRSVDRVFARGPQGQVRQHIGCATDFTVEKEAQLALSERNIELEDKVAQHAQELAALNETLEERIGLQALELEDAVGELEQLTFIATHDLKVPVNNLSRLARMFDEGAADLTPDQAEQIGWINACVEQLQLKIQGLVLVAQLRLSSEFPCRRLNLCEQVRNTIEELQEKMPGAVLPVSCDIPNDLTIEFSKFELGSICMSLLDNAVKYAAADRPLQITIRARLEGGRAVLTVADNGTGLDSTHDKAKVFGLFSVPIRRQSAVAFHYIAPNGCSSGAAGKLPSAVSAASGPNLKLHFQNKDR